MKILFVLIAMLFSVGSRADAGAPRFSCQSAEVGWLANAEAGRVDVTPRFPAGCFAGCSVESVSVRIVYRASSDYVSDATVSITVPGVEWPLKKGWSGKGLAAWTAWEDGCERGPCGGIPGEASAAVECTLL